MDHFSQSIKDHVVDGVEDVPPDGHYGYRCCAEMLNLSAEDEWITVSVRSDMLSELRQHKVYMSLLIGGEKEYNVVECVLDYYEIKQKH